MSLERNSPNNYGTIGWWWNSLVTHADGEPWASMPEKMRKDLLQKMKRACYDLADGADVNEQDMRELIELGGRYAFYDALLKSLKWPKSWKNTKAKFMTNMRGEMGASFVPNMKRVDFHTETGSSHRSRGKPITPDEIMEYSPLNFERRFCKICGKKIRTINGTGICRKCQRNGAKIEH